MAEILHPDVVATFPQSGEVFRGKDNYLAMMSNYPQGLPKAEALQKHGGHQTVTVSTIIPFAIPTITVTGGKSDFVVEGEAGPYSDGIVYKMVSIGKIRDGKLAEQTTYFAPPFDPPEWRQPFTD